MKSKKEVEAQIEHFISFSENNEGKRYPASSFNEIMGHIALKEVLERYSSESEVLQFIKSEIQKCNKSAKENSSNLRGGAEILKIKHYLWVIDAKIEDYLDENGNLREMR
jgi:hypothetical protein